MEGKPPLSNPTMQAENASPMASAFGILRQFARKRPAVERCELCSAALEHEHPHLIELAARKLLCACGACALLFDGSANGKYKRVPRDPQFLESFHMTDSQWDALTIPINMAFFFFSSIENRVVTLYPSPAGAVESLLSMDIWNEIVEENPALRDMKPDVEALLVNRVGHAREATKAEYFIAPMDECYKLVGLIRSQWRGLSGGTEVWQEIGNFFTALRQKAIVVNEEPHA
jgi:hypothetical protein